MTITAFDRRQYVLLLGLLRTLGSRRELTSQFGTHAPALGILGGLSLLIGGFVALGVLGGRMSAYDVLMICQGMTIVLLVPLLVSEAADALLNPAEVSVLAHRPIGNLTYLAAKLTYLLGFALTLGLALNVLPALAGSRLAGTAWFYPVTHLGAAALGSAFTALATCGVFGVVFRLVPVSHVRAAALWAQLIGGLSIPLAPHLLRLVEVRLDFDAPYWSGLPIAWFAALGLAGQDGGPELSLPLALPSMIVALLLVAGGLGVLTQGYMTRTSTARRAARASGARLRSPLLPVFRWLTRSRPGMGAGLFVVAMARRDWQFRRATLRAAVPMLLLLITFPSGLRSPFDDGDRFTAVHLLPHVIGLTMVVALDFLPFSDHYRARWIFQTVPASALRGVVRGTLAAIWLLGAAMPSLLLFAVAAIRWNVPHAALFAIYTLAVLSFYLGTFAWIQGGLPFTRPVDPARAAGNMSFMFGFLIVALAIGIVQAVWLFPDATRIGLAIVALAVAAGCLGWLSMRVLEARARSALASFAAGTPRTFSIIRDDTGE